MNAQELKNFINDNFSQHFISHNREIQKVLKDVETDTIEDFSEIYTIVTDIRDSLMYPTFKKYGSIENTYRKEILNKILEHGHQRHEYVVEEKVHGANFSIIISGEEEPHIQCGKRTGLLGEASNFYNYQVARDAMRENLIAMYNYIRTVEYPGSYHIRIFGELFGGAYPHDDVDRVPYMKSVQKGVFYTPEIKFYGFDIVVDRILLSKDKVYELFEMFDIFYSKPVFRGTLEECLEYPNEYPTTIPGRLGLPELPDNICEGNVITTVEPVFFGNGSRVILKNKNARFAEKNKEKKPRVPQEKLELKLDEATTPIYNEMITYVTENRLRNVISKMGEINDKMFGKLLGAMMGDVMEDFIKEHRTEFKALTATQQRIVHKMLSSEITQMIRKDFLNIMDGNY